MTKRALVTLAIGKDYQRRFERFCRRDWSAYAARHGYDLFVIEEPLDSSVRAQNRSPAWQKCLVLGMPALASYDRVVWVDADIAINPSAPSIADSVPRDRIGVIDEHSFPTPQTHQDILGVLIETAPETGELSKRFWRAWRNPGDWHGFVGLPTGQAHIVQTGVMVLSPAHHRALLEDVYRSCEDSGLKSHNYEMRYLSHAIQAQGLQHWIDPRFNALIWWLYLSWSVWRAGMPTDVELRDFVREAYRRSYFLHFAGSANLLSMLESAMP